MTDATQEQREVLELVNSVDRPAVFREKMEEYGEEIDHEGDTQSE